ncbi:MAG: hypothetical protein L0Y44_03400 [Phycisphaerales bacterium]|nr:hypothetical protein [Phycisphaerales bacterium]
MAIFSWKKSGAAEPKPTAKGTSSGDVAATEASDTTTGDGFVPQPEKARVWFDYAKTASDSSNYEYALTCYANGIKLDPDTMSAHEAMLDVALKYVNKGGKPATGKEIRNIDGAHPIAKFAAAEFAWMKEITNSALALKALEAAIKASQYQYGHWIAPTILNVLRRTKKPSKSTFVQAKDLFKQVNAWDEALTAGQIAVQIDPTDNALDHELKDISAQRAMDAGGYEKAAGQEGGFRAFVKDSEKQRQLIEAEAITGGQSMEERNLLRAKAEYEKHPTVPDVINQYAQLIKKKGTPEAEQHAFDIYMKGYKDTGEYRFRMAAGDIRMDQLRRDVDGLQARSEAAPTDIALKGEAQFARQRLLDLESNEVNERVSKYPTDRQMKMRLGEVEFAMGSYENASVAFQAAKDEPKLRVRAGHMLGKSFAALSWHMEAINEFKEALNAIDATEKDRELAIRYDLMVSLIEYARSERDIGHAKEALDICSGIVRKDIGYRDIRARRKEVDQLIKDLSGAGRTA